MEVKYHNHKTRTMKAKQVWLKMAEEYNNGVDPEKIVNNYKNPRTGKPYTRAHLYWVLKQVAKIKN